MGIRKLLQSIFWSRARERAFLLKTAPRVWSRTPSEEGMEPSCAEDGRPLAMMSEDFECGETDGILIVWLISTKEAEVRSSVWSSGQRHRGSAVLLRGTDAALVAVRVSSLLMSASCCDVFSTECSAPGLCQSHQSRIVTNQRNHILIPAGSELCFEKKIRYGKVSAG